MRSPTRSTPRVVGLGQCCLDYVVSVDAYPAADAKCEYRDLAIQGGGPVATALVALSRWGVTSSFMGIVGDDRFGPIIERDLAGEGLDVAGLRIRPDSRSQFAFIVAEPGVARRTVFWRRPTGAPLSPGEIDYGLIRRAGVLHTDGLFADATLAAAAMAREAGVSVVVDAGSLRPGMIDLARRSDYFLASESFAREFGEGGSPRDVCRELHRLGPRLTAVTLGPRGYVAADGDRVMEGSAYPVDAVDTTGCGDIFHAGFVYGLTERWALDRCLDFGAWAASRVSLALGGRTGIPDPTDYPGAA